MNCKICCIGDQWRRGWQRATRLHAKKTLTTGVLSVHAIPRASDFFHIFATATATVASKESGADEGEIAYSFVKSKPDLLGICKVTAGDFRRPGSKMTVVWQARHIRIK